MIYIKASVNKLLITGHEITSDLQENAPHCNAISAISLAGLNCFKPYQIKYVNRTGYLKVWLLDHSFKTRVKWQMLINQLYFIYKAAGKNVIKWGSKWN